MSATRPRCDPSSQRWSAGCWVGQTPRVRSCLTQVAEALLAVADLVTLARTAVEKDHKGTVLEAYAPEAPTRFVKMLGQLVRGGLAIGLDLDHCMRLAFRVAHDSLNPMRLICLLDVAAHPASRTSRVTERVQKPRVTVDRYLQELHILGLLRVEKVGDGQGWRYTLADGVEPYVLNMLKSVTGKTTKPGYWVREESADGADGAYAALLTFPVAPNPQRQRVVTAANDLFTPNLSAAVFANAAPRAAGAGIVTAH